MRTVVFNLKLHVKPMQKLKNVWQISSGLRSNAAFFLLKKY